LRTGSALNLNVLSVNSTDEKPNVTHEFVYEAALTAAVNILPFLSLHLEAAVSYDDAPYRSSARYQTTTGNIRFIDNEKSWSLLFPVMIKFPMRLKNIVLSPYAGAGITMPLKNLTGFTPFLNLGGDLRILFGPGALVWDLRYGMDIVTARKIQGGIEYFRHRAALSFGYQFAFFTKTSTVK
jgi:hypothetical protein